MRSAAELRLLSELLDHALDLPVAERTAWLAGLRGEAERLGPTLREMLARSTSSESADPLERGPSFTAIGADPVEPAFASGDTVGPYRLRRELGRGGMGQVWLAERADGQLMRQVALKLPMLGLRRSRLVERFARERDFLAGLVHPHIARLYDAGLAEDGQPWLALEYVEGTSIIEWCDRRRLGLTDRVRLFRQVLGAVHHAHVNLVLHRDLKPANILVNDAGEVRLLDFGIAKMLETEGSPSAATALTRDGDRALTVQYASPEQLLGRPLTTASDVYSLGVVLYRMICGASPYEPKTESAVELERVILEDDPRAPSRRTLSVEAAEARGSEKVPRLLARDFDAIVLKALSKDPERRYASAEAFDADLGRWITGKPLHACAPTVSYRLSKFIRRYRAGVTLGIFAVLSVLTVAAVAVALGFQARTEARRAVAAREFVFDLLARAGPPTSKGLSVTAKEFLGAAATQVNALQEPALRADLLREIARVDQQMELHAEARPVFDALILALRQENEPRPLAKALLDAAGNALHLHDIERANLLVREAEPLSTARPVDRELKYWLGLRKGWLALESNDPAAAQIEFSGALSEISERWPYQAEMRREALFGLSSAARDQGNSDAALAMLKQAIELEVPAGSAPQVERWMLLKATMVFEQGKLTLVPAIAQGSTFCLTYSHPTETCIAARELYVETMVGLGNADKAQGHAARLLEQLRETRSPTDRALIVIPLAHFAQATGAWAQYATVRTQLKSLADADRESPSLVAPDLLGTLQLTQAEIDAQEGRFDDAERRAGPLSEEIARPSDSRAKIVARARTLVGAIAISQGREAAGLAALEGAQEAYATLYGAQHPSVARARFNRALALLQLGRTQEARTLADQAVPILEKAYGVDAPTFQKIKDLHAAMSGASGARTHFGMADFVL